MLTPTQLTAVERYLKKCGIRYEEVYNELFDHFVNAIDAEMMNHKLFNKALDEVSKQFGGRRGLTNIQAKRYKAIDLYYRRNLWNYLLLCIRWPNLLLTFALAWLLWTLIGLVPTMQLMMFFTYLIMLINAIPLLLSSVLFGRHLWQFILHRRSVALSLEGLTLLSKSLGTALIYFYPNLFVWLGWMAPKNAPLTLTEQAVFFVSISFALFLSCVQINLIIRYAKSVGQTPGYLSK